MLECATREHRAGNLLEARRLYGRCLAASPGHPLALFRSGLLELQDGRLQAARTAIEAAVQAAPTESRHHLGLGQVLDALALWEEAARAYRRALACDCASPDAHRGLATALHRAGDLDQAVDAYRAALALAPNDPLVLGNLGAALRERGDLEGAIRLLGHAMALAPRAVAHRVNLGIALIERRDFAAAESLLRGALELEPGDADAAFNLGNALRGLGRNHEAAQMFQRAADSRPGHADAWNNLGNTCKELGDFSRALRAFEAAIGARPQHLAALNNAGCLLRTLGRMDDAETLLRRGLALDPRHPALLGNLGNVLKDAGALEEAIECFRRSLELEPSNHQTHSNLAYALSFQSLEPEPVREECLRWNERFAAPLRPSAAQRVRDPSPDRRLIVGYLSADFRDHCQTLFTLPLLAHHDHERFKIHCYSSVERPDEYTSRLASLADEWREVRSLDDERLSGVIRGDGVDILVDLTMHMSGGRPLVLARKPAPVQIAWLAYPGTTGMDAIDCRLSDARLDPQGFDAHYVERTLRLPDSFWCYHPLTDEPAVAPLPALERRHLTLGCLNNPCKLTDRTLDLWGGVMRALPQARLLLMVPEGRHRLRLAGRLAARSIEPARVGFVSFQPRGEYLKTYAQIDFALDTFPYNGHTTSLDALWMGVPTVTRVGATCVGRGGLSQLHQLGLARLAAATDESFVDIAVALAADLHSLATLRGTLRARLEASALMNHARFARHIEAAYRAAWHEHLGVAAMARAVSSSAFGDS